MRATLPAALILSSALALTACAAGEKTTPLPADEPPPAAGMTDGATEDDAVEVTRAELKDADGASRGTVTIEDVDDGRLAVVVEASGLTPGFHAVHLHAIGKCEPNSADPKDATKKGDFLSSGGHLGEGDHPDHAADLPPLLALKDGTASLRVVTDRVDSDTLLDDDGSAFVVHEKPDNFANIPERYASGGADAETKKAGDAGPRVVCGAFLPE